MYAALWQAFGIPGDRAEVAPAHWLQRLQVWAMAHPQDAEGGE